MFWEVDQHWIPNIGACLTSFDLGISLFWKAELFDKECEVFYATLIFANHLIWP